MTPSNCHTLKMVNWFVTSLVPTSSEINLLLLLDRAGPRRVMQMTFSRGPCTASLYSYTTSSQKHHCGFKNICVGFRTSRAGFHSLALELALALALATWVLGNFDLESNFQRHVRPSLWHISWKSEHGAATVIPCFCCILRFKISPFKPNCGS